MLKFWRQQGGGPANRTAVTGRTPDSNIITTLYAPIDYARMARLNARFKARKETELGGSDGLTNTEALKASVPRQLEAWREARSRGLGMTHLIAMRRAELKRKRKRELDRLGRGGNKETFAAKRAKQLKDWRLKVYGQGVKATRIVLRTPRPKLSATSMAASAAGASVR